MSDLKVFFQDIEELIRSGQRGVARQAISSIKVATLTRAQRAPLANLARRVGLTKRSLEILSPIIGPEAATSQSPTGLERASYSASLAAVGAFSEALECLKPVQHLRVPEVFLYQAYTYLHQWEYGAAIPFLRLYLAEADKLTAYQIAVAQTNLASCHNYVDDFELSLPLLADVIAQAREKNWNTILRDALLFQAQSWISLKNWANAERGLRDCSELSKRHGFALEPVSKWELILLASRTGLNTRIESGFRDLQKEAQKSQRFEIVRDCDYYLASLTHNSDLASRLWFGSPMSSYKNRLAREFSSWYEVPKSYEWDLTRSVPFSDNLRASSEKPREWIDLFSGRCSNKDIELTPRDLTLECLRALACDFYRPQKIGNLFSRIYLGELYNCQSSPLKVKNLIFRLRRQLENVEFPLEILGARSDYHLSTLSAVTLTIPARYRDAAVLEKESHHALLSKLAQEWPYRSFSTRQAADFLQISTEETRRILSEACREKRLLKSGQMRSTLYRFSK